MSGCESQDCNNVTLTRFGGGARGRGRGGGGGVRGRGGRGGGGGRKPVAPTAEQLDADLEAYKQVVFSVLCCG